MLSRWPGYCWICSVKAVLAVVDLLKVVFVVVRSVKGCMRCSGSVRGCNCWV